MREIFTVLRFEDGTIVIHLEGRSTATLRRLLIDATYNVNSLEDLDAGSTPATTAEHLAAAGAVDLSGATAADAVAVASTAPATVAPDSNPTTTAPAAGSPAASQS